MTRPTGTVHHSECAIREDGDKIVTLWYVRGMLPLYPTKLVAEVAARASFPHEDEDVRYGRISYREYIDTNYARD